MVHIQLLLVVPFLFGLFTVLVNDGQVCLGDVEHQTIEGHVRGDASNVRLELLVGLHPQPAMFLSGLVDQLAIDSVVEVTLNTTISTDVIRTSSAYLERLACCALVHLRLISALAVVFILGRLGLHVLVVHLAVAGQADMIDGVELFVLLIVSGKVFRLSLGGRATGGGHRMGLHQIGHRLDVLDNLVQLFALDLIPATVGASPILDVIHPRLLQGRVATRRADAQDVEEEGLAHLDAVECVDSIEMFPRLWMTLPGDYLLRFLLLLHFGQLHSRLVVECRRSFTATTTATTFVVLLLALANIIDAHFFANILASGGAHLDLLDEAGDER